MHALLVCSIVGLAIIIVKYFTLTISGIQSKKLLSQINELLKQRKFDEATDLCESSKGPVAAILSSGLRKIHQGSDRVVRAIEHTGAMELSFLERGLVALATIATIAPLMGFLGTVAGMIQAFGAIEAYGEVEATLVAGGIKVALITTATGLIIAIPISAAHSYFVTKVDRIIMDMEETSENMVDMIFQMEQEVGGSQST
jgi:biopolymer transport protein ExbB